MPITRCHHHGFTVSSIERSRPFCRDTLGLELVCISLRRNLPSYDQILGHEDIALQAALLRHPHDGFLLELFEDQNPRGQARDLDNTFVDASHVAFQVDDVVCR